MKTSIHRAGILRLETAMMAFFGLAILCLLIVYIIDPTIYVQTLSLSPSTTDRYPVVINLFIAGIFALIGLLIFGIIRHWRWVFWVMLIAFSASIIQIPVTLLQVTGVMPDVYPRWYSLFRLAIAFVEVGIAIWMIQIYRQRGVWGRGKRGK